MRSGKKCWHYEFMGSAYVRCQKCRARTRMIVNLNSYDGIEKSKMRAIKVWNRRANNG